MPGAQDWVVAGRHAAAEVAPITAVFWLLGQGLQVDWEVEPTAPLKKPYGQGVHAAAVPGNGANVPAGHEIQADDPAGEKLPGGQ